MSFTKGITYSGVPPLYTYIFNSIIRDSTECPDKNYLKTYVRH